MRLYILLIICCFSLGLGAQEKTMLVLGDSISAAYGLNPEQGWVHLLKKRLERLGYRYKVINASISGDTTRGAQARLGRILAQVSPDISIIELGGNDGLRGLSLQELSVNLQAIIAELIEVNSTVLLVPMRLPPNYGPVYTDRFEGVYQDLARNEGVILTEFILQDIADNEELMQSDGIHPRAEAQEKMLDILWSALQPQLGKNKNVEQLK
jgi:acyl-CoA thioesterase I